MEHRWNAILVRRLVSTALCGLLLAVGSVQAAPGAMAAAPSATLSHVGLASATLVTAGASDIALSVQVQDTSDASVTGLAASDFTITSSDLQAGTYGALTPVSVTATSTPGGYTVILTDTDANDGNAQTLTVAVDSVALAQTASVTVAPGAAASLQGQPISAIDLTAGQSETYTFTAEDAYGNPVPGVQVDFGVTGSLAASGLSAASGETGSTGEAEVTYQDALAGDSGTVTGTVDGTSISAAGGTLTVVVGSADSSESGLTPAAAAESAGSVDTYTLVLKDAAGNPLSGLTSGDFIPTEAGAANSSDVSFGVVGETSTPGTYTFTATDYVAESFTVSVVVDCVIIAASSQETVTAAGATSISASPGGALSLPAGSSQAISFTVKDAFGNPVTGQAVAFATTGSLAAGGLGSAKADTDGSGEVQVDYTGTATGGSGTVTGTVYGTAVTAASGTFTWAAESLDSTRSSLAPSAATAAAGDQDTYTLVLEDTGGGPMAGLAGSAFTMTEVGARSGDVAFSGVSETSKPGTYTFSASDNVAGIFTVSVSVMGVTIVASSPETVEAGLAAGISVLPTAALTVSAGQPQTLTFTVQDSYGNPVQGATVQFQTTGSLSPQDLNLSTSGTGSDGQVQVTYQGTAAGDSGTVTGSAGGLSAAAGPLSVVAGPPSRLTLVVSPALVQVGGQVTVSGAVYDAYGNPVAGVTVTISLGRSDMKATTDANGEYEATATAAAEAGTESLTASAQGTSKALTETATFEAAAASTPPTRRAAPPVTRPSVTAISPGTGSALGGTSVTILGSGFSGTTAVHFGPALATSYTVESSGEISAVAPAGTGAASVDITVTTGAGTSATVAADRFTFAQQPAAFSDVPTTYWAYQAIEAMAGRGIVSGFPDGAFQPDATLTRAEFVKMLVLSLHLQPDAAATAFSDVPPRAWFAPYVSAAVEAQIVQGVTSRSFAPDATLSREAMAVLLARALKLTDTVPLHFTDVGRISSWARTSVAETVAKGLMSGFPDGSFRPLAVTTRAEAAAILAAVWEGTDQ